MTISIRTAALSLAALVFMPASAVYANTCPGTVVGHVSSVGGAIEARTASGISPVNMAVTLEEDNNPQQQYFIAPVDADFSYTPDQQRALMSVVFLAKS